MPYDNPVVAGAARDIAPKKKYYIRLAINVL